MVHPRFDRRPAAGQARSHRRIFYGWWMVGACAVVALFGNALGLFGASVYLHALAEARGWSIGQISGAITLLYLTSALAMLPVGRAVQRRGPRAVVAIGALALSGGVFWIGQLAQLWQVYPAFMLMGVAWACLSTTAVTTTLAPWFEKHQGRAASIASLGASAGGMLGVPVLLLGKQAIGFAATTAAASLTALVALLAIAILVLRHRPQDLGLLPDGAAAPAVAAVRSQPEWTLRAAMRTGAFHGIVAAFGIGMMVQIGFLTHHVAFVTPVLGTAGASATISAAAIAALAGRLLLVRWADRLRLRVTAGGALLTAAASLLVLALFSTPAVLVAASVVFGLTVGNVTTLSAIIVRREFGAASFGVIYGAVATGIQLAIALGPAFYGLLHDRGGTYALPLVIAAALDTLAALVILRGGGPALPRPTGP